MGNGVVDNATYAAPACPMRASPKASIRCAMLVTADARFYPAVRADWPGVKLLRDMV